MLENSLPSDCDISCLFPAGIFAIFLDIYIIVKNKHKDNPNNSENAQQNNNSET